MKKWILYCLLLISARELSGQQSIHNKMAKNRVVLPEGWSLTPAGHSLALGDLPRDMTLSSGKKYLAVVKSGGAGCVLQLIDAEREKTLGNMAVRGEAPVIAFSADERFLYVSGDGSSILKYGILRNGFVLTDSIYLGKTGQMTGLPAGLSVDDKKQVAYLVMRTGHVLYRIDLLRQSPLQRFELPGEGAACLLAANTTRLYISCRDCDRVVVFDTERSRLNGEIVAAGSGGDLCMSSDGRFLFEVHPAGHAVSVIDPVGERLLQKIEVLLPGAPFNGSAANALALSRDNRTLYVANGDYNCLTVFDVSQRGMARLKGTIPVGWYPTAVGLSGNRIFVANGKGFSSLAGPLTSGVIDMKNMSREARYIMGLFTGSLSVVEEPGEKLLETYSKLVFQNCPHASSTKNNRSASLFQL